MDLASGFCYRALTFGTTFPLHRSQLYVYKPVFIHSIISEHMGLFTVLLVVVIVLAIVGMGWKTFSLGVINGFDRAVDVGTPLVKDLTQQATEYIQDPSLIEIS